MMADQSTEECSQKEAKYCESTPLLQQQVGNIHEQSATVPEILEACRDAIRKIKSVIDENRERELDFESELDTLLNSPESLYLSNEEFRKQSLTAFDSTRSSDLPECEEQLRTQLILPPPQPLSKQDDSVKGSVNTGFEGLERFETEKEYENLIPAGTAQELPVPPRQSGSCSDVSNKPNLEKQEIQQNKPWFRNLQVRTFTELTDRALKYITLSRLCFMGFIICSVTVLHLNKFQIWTSSTAAVTAVLGLLGAVLFCVKTANQVEQDDAERSATSTRESIQYEIIPNRTFLDPNVLGGFPTMDKNGKVDGLG